jgi:hypothetical protein
MDRVVRRMRLTPSLVSSAPTRRVTAAGARRSRRVAPARLPASTTATHTAISAKRPGIVPTRETVPCDQSPFPRLLQRCILRRTPEPAMATTDIAFTSAVKAVRERRGSRGAYVKVEARGGWQGGPRPTSPPFSPSATAPISPPPSP